MSEEIVLNRREGVVAAQDIHLNRSVYSEPYPFGINEILVAAPDGGIKSGYIERLHPIITAKEAIKGTKSAAVEIALTEVYRFLEYSTKTTVKGEKTVKSNFLISKVYNNNEVGTYPTNLVGKKVIESPTFYLEQVISEVGHKAKDTLTKTGIKIGVIFP